MLSFLPPLLYIVQQFLEGIIPIMENQFVKGMHLAHHLYPILSHSYLKI